MAILAECPSCRRKQSIKNKICSCGENLDRAKSSRRVRYWVSYRLPGGKQRREPVKGEELDPRSIEDARTMHSKRVVQKAENRILDIKQDSKMTFQQLSKWYLELEKVKALASFPTIQTYLKKFNSEFGNVIVSQLKPSDLENLQEKRKREGMKAKTVDDEINYTKSMVIRAFDNDKVSGDVLKAFRRVKKVLKAHSNRRDRILTPKEFLSLIDKAPKHLKDILLMGYWTGMRKGEIIDLQWDRVDLKIRFIRLEASDTKEGQPKTIPIGEEINRILSRLPRPIKGGPVFLYVGNPILKRFETALKSTCEKAGILWGRDVKGGFIFHDLRHTFITDMRRAGVPRTVTMSITGHSIRDMNERYDTVEEWEKLEGIKKLEALRGNVDHSVDQSTSKTT